MPETVATARPTGQGRRSASVPFRGPLLALALAMPTTLLPGCITQAMWATRSETVQNSRTVTFDVQDVRGRLLDPDLDTGSVVQLELRLRAGGASGPSGANGAPTVAAAAAERVPPHLRRFLESPAWLVVRPWCDAPYEWHRLPGASVLAPERFEIAVDDASWMRAGARATVVLHGVLAAGDVGDVVPIEAAPEWADAPPLRVAATPAALQPCLAAARAHDWPRLLAPQATGPFRCEPLAWLDAEQRVVAAEELAGWLTEAARPAADEPAARQTIGAGEHARAAARRAAGCSLLLRATNEPGQRFLVRVRVPILLQGRDLLLSRDGPRVRWQHRQVWSARLTGEPPPETRGLPPLELPLVRRRLAWTSLQSWQESRRWFPGDYVLKAVLTPVTVAADVAVQTNPALRKLAEWLLGVKFEEPERPDLGSGQ